MGAPDEMAAVMAEFPAWEVWRGVKDHWYARRLKTSPPPVVRADTAAALREKIEAAESGS